MSIKCEKCGCEIDGNSPICMNCGAAVPESNLNKETKERIEAEKHDNHVASNASSTKAFGAFLLILGIVADVISMFLIFSDGFGAYSFITIGGTIVFLLGLMLFSNG